MTSSPSNLKQPPVEDHTPQRLAEFLLANAIGEDEYSEGCRRCVQGRTV